MQTLLKILLLLAAVVLTILCVRSVLNPIRFVSEKERREKAVMLRLSAIGEAEAFFYAEKAYYTDNFDVLINFVKSDSVIFLQINKICSPDSMQFVPYSGGKIVDLQVGEANNKDGKSESAFEAKVPYEFYLYGINKQELSQLSTEALQSGVYPGLRISSSNH